MAAYFGSLTDLLGDLWLYMLAGFVLAGIVEEFVPQDRLLRYFGRNDPASLVRAAGVGFLVSACSCGAIPLVASLRRRGTSTATALTLLLAAPWLGIPMLLIYVSFLGWARTIFLVGLAILVAFCAGLIFARLERRGDIAAGLRYGGGCGDAKGEGNDDYCADGGDSCTEDEPCAESDSPDDLRHRLLVRLPRRVAALGRGIGIYLLVGTLIAALPRAFAPPDTIQAWLGQRAGMVAVFAALPIAAVIEACSEGFAVVAGQLFEMGASLAVVFVVTMVGVATDFTELSVLWGVYDRRTTVVYVSTGTALTIVSGILLQLLL